MTDTDILTLNLTKSMANGQKNHTLSLKSVADILGKSERTVYRYVKTGKLSASVVKIENEKQLRFNAEEVDKFRDTLTSGVDGQSPDMSGIVSKKEPTGFLELYKDLRDKYDALLIQFGYLKSKEEGIKLLEERVSSLAQKNQGLEGQVSSLTTEKQTITQDNERLTTERQQVAKDLSASQVRLRQQPVITIVLAVLALLAGFVLSPGMLQQIITFLTSR